MLCTVHTVHVRPWTLSSRTASLFPPGQPRHYHNDNVRNLSSNLLQSSKNTMHFSLQLFPGLVVLIETIGSTTTDAVFRFAVAESQGPPAVRKSSTANLWIQSYSGRRPPWRWGEAEHEGPGLLPWHMLYLSYTRLHRAILYMKKSKKWWFQVQMKSALFM